MTEQLKQKLNDSAVLRWSVLALVAFTMLCGYFLTDVMSPLKPMLEKELLWDSLDYGFFTSAYGWFNVFLLMLIFGGIILDKMGVRFTGMGACLLMVFGCGLKYYAITTTFPEGAMLFGFKMQVALAALGYAIFGVGVEIADASVFFSGAIFITSFLFSRKEGEKTVAKLLQVLPSLSSVISRQVYYLSREIASFLWPLCIQNVNRI